MANHKFGGRHLEAVSSKTVIIIIAMTREIVVNKYKNL